MPETSDNKPQIQIQETKRTLLVFFKDGFSLFPQAGFKNSWTQVVTLLSSLGS
jgi:hypothetical protein